MPIPSIQELAPAFTAGALLPSKEMGEITLSDYRGKWVVFFWYPLDFTWVPNPSSNIRHDLAQWSYTPPSPSPSFSYSILNDLMKLITKSDTANQNLRLFQLSFSSEHFPFHRQFITLLGRFLQCNTYISTVPLTPWILWCLTTSDLSARLKSSPLVTAYLSF